MIFNNKSDPEVGNWPRMSLREGKRDGTVVTNVNNVTVSTKRDQGAVIGRPLFIPCFYSSELGSSTVCLHI